MVNSSDTYTFIKSLGKGAGGEVYLAQDVRLERNVAIKTLYCATANANTQALQEAKLLASVSHPNIVQIFHAFENCEHQVSLVMEYVEGNTLAQFVRESVLSLDQKLDLLIQLSAGLSAAHQKNIVHCDLKPSNILVSNNGQLKISDFGIAQLSVNEPSSDVFATPAYMSPEQVNQQKLDGRTDIFSLGVIAYELLTGSHPFLHHKNNDISAAICDYTPPTPKQLIGSLPTELSELVMQMLEKALNKRTHSALVLCEHFKQIRQKLSTTALQAQTTQPLTKSPTKPSKALPSKQKFAFAVAVTISFLLLAFYYFSDRHTQGNELRNVLVIAPKLTNSNNIAESQKKLVLSTVEDAMRQSVINTEGMYLVSHREVNRLKGEGADSIKQLKQAAGASDVIVSELECSNHNCSAVFSRLVDSLSVPEQLQVESEVKWIVPIEKYNQIYTTSQTRFLSLFPENNIATKEGLVSQPVREKDYQEYIKLYSLIRGEGQYTDANLQRLDRLLQRAPHFYSAYQLFGELTIHLYLNTSDLSYLTRFDELLNDAPTEYKATPYFDIDRFWVFSFQKKFFEAGKAIKSAAARNVNQITLLELEGNYFFQQGDYVAAVSKYQQALKYRESFTISYNLAVAYLRSGAIDKSAKIATKLLNLMPDNSKYIRFDASVKIHKGELTQAINSYLRLLKNSKATRDLSNLALAYTLNGEYDKALPYALKAHQKSPQNTLWLLNLADVYNALDEKKLSQHYYQLVIDAPLASNTVRSLLDLAQANIHLSNSELAIEKVNEARALAPENSDVFYTSALINSLLGETTSATYQVKKALSKGTGAVWFNLPWFNNLCDKDSFKELMLQYGNDNRCVPNH